MMNTVRILRKAAFTAAFFVSMFLPSAQLAAKRTASVRPVAAQSSRPQSKSQTPDFAFPKTVEKNAEAALSSALTARKYPDALAEMMKVIIARELISKAYVSGAMSLCDSVGALMPQPYSGLADLIQASMLSKMYSASQWQYSQRQLPADSVPADDPSLWSQGIFADRILRLVNRSREGYGAAAEIPLSDLSAILTDYKEAADAGMKSDIFMMMCGVSALEPFSATGYEIGVIPFTASPSSHSGAGGKYDSLMADIYRKGKVSGEKLRTFLDVYFVKTAQRKGLDVNPFLISELDALSDPSLKAVLMYYLFESGNFYNSISVYQAENAQRLADCEPAPPVNYFGVTFPARPLPDLKEFYTDLKTLDSSSLDKETKSLVREMINFLNRESIRIENDKQYLPGDSIRLRLHEVNCKSSYVAIYRLNDSIISLNEVDNKNFKNIKLVSEKTLRIDENLPFVKELEINFPPLPPGIYVYNVAKDKEEMKSLIARNKGFNINSIFRVSELNMAAVDGFGADPDTDDFLLIVNSGRNGAPVEGASVILVNDRKTWLSQGKDILNEASLTNKDGWIRYKSYRANFNAEGRYYAFASKDGSEIDDAFWSGKKYFTQLPYTTQANILTDLSLYHRGDTVRFSTVLYEANDRIGKLLPNETIGIWLRDASNQVVDSLSCTTDDCGRIAGEFVLPKDGRLGQWGITVASNLGLAREKRRGEFPSRNSIVGQQYFEVADYKAPTFYVDLKLSDSKAPLEEKAEFCGEVKSYSGVPLAGVKVSYKVEYIPFWWWRRSNGASYGGEAVTGEDGSFTITLPTANLRGTRFAKGSFVIRATAVSAAGESQQSERVIFSLGNDVCVQPDIADSYKVDGDSLRFSVPVRDAMSRMVEKKVEYEVKNSEGKVVASGEFMSPSLSIPAKLFPSGRYTLDFHIKGNKRECAGNGDAEAQVTIWRPADKIPPIETSLWVPEDNVSGISGSKVRVPYGNSYTDGKILCLISCTDGTSEICWLSPKGKNAYVEVEVPGEYERKEVTFLATYNLKTICREVSIIPAKQLEKLEIKASSFRDRIDPGTPERWTFEISVGGKPAPYVPAMAVLSNKALDAINPSAWNFNVYTGYWTFPANISFSYLGSGMCSDSWKKNFKWPSYSVSFPNFNTFRYNLYGEGQGVVSLDAGSSEGVVVRTEGIVNQSAVMRKASNTAIRAMKEESADEAPAMMTMLSADEGGSNSDTSGVPLRTNEMALAFFRPNLKSDGGGSLAIDFEVPDFNTTWKLQICGYDSELHTGILTLDAVAAKKVMVQSNPPRFVRYGDTVTFASTLFNNSEEVIPVGGRIEICNPLDGSILASREFSGESLAPAASRVVSMEYLIPDDLTVISLRVYALGGGFSDGEQVLIPVLPASSVVTEAQTYFLAPGAKEFSVKLPKFSAGSSVSLQYCDNPVWYCVSSLPVMMDENATNTFQLMRSLFGGSIANGLADKYPAIRVGIEKMISEEGRRDSLLVSNLEKNPELKIMALSSTPWKANSTAETLRMQQIGNLLNESENSRVRSVILSRLALLQQADGGWKWTSGDKEPASYVTLYVLRHFAIMKQTGVVRFDNPMDSMCRAGMKWYERKAVEDYNDCVKNKKIYPYSSLLGYLFTRSGLTSESPVGTFSLLATRALDEISKNWRNYSLDDKATAAMVLHRAGRKREALTILESISQFASSSPEKGVWFDNNASGCGALFDTSRILEAFSEIMPESLMIDGMRQWMLLSRQTNDWSSNPYMAEVICALLTSGSDWTVSSAPAEILVGGEPLDVHGAILTGELTIPLDAKSVSGKRIEIRRDAPSPAWGGVISRYVAPMKDVKAASVPDLSISKSIVKITETENGTVATGGDLHVGDRVRITLTIRCGKNMQYVAVKDERPACLEPVEQISGYEYKDGIGFYRETRTSDTNLFIGYLPKGDFIITYDCFVDRPGVYSEGIATAQSQYAPVFTAHSAGALISVAE